MARRKRKFVGGPASPVFVIGGQGKWDVYYGSRGGGGSWGLGRITQVAPFKLEAYRRDGSLLGTFANLADAGAALYDA